MENTTVTVTGICGTKLPGDQIMFALEEMRVAGPVRIKYEHKNTAASTSFQTEGANLTFLHVK